MGRLIEAEVFSTSSTVSSMVLAFGECVDEHVRRMGVILVRIWAARPLRVGQTSIQGADIASKQELARGVKGEAGNDILELDRKTFRNALLHDRNCLRCMTVEDFEVTDPISGKEWACHGAVEFPHVAVGIEDSEAKKLTQLLEGQRSLGKGVELRSKNGFDMFRLCGEKLSRI
jgi:hypothetical protein